MVGPSSSHTAGPARIGMAINRLLEDRPKKIEFLFDRKGSFAATYHAQGSDYGFLCGLLGYDAGDEIIKNSLKEAEDSGIVVLFKVIDFNDAVRPNHAKIIINTEEGIEGLNNILDFIKPGVSCEEVEKILQSTINKYGIMKESRMGYTVGLSYPPVWTEKYSIF